MARSNQLPYTLIIIILTRPENCKQEMFIMFIECNNVRSNKKCYSIRT